MSSVVKKLIREITELAVEVTNKTKHNVFARYYGHVNNFEVSYDNGINEVKLLDIYLDYKENNISKLKQAKRKLKKLLEE